MALPFVLSIPHCGKEVPDNIRSRMELSAPEIDESIDHGTHEIFSHLPVQIVIAASMGRLVVDLNRGPEQLDPKGVVALTDYYGRSIYQSGKRPSPQEVQQRLADFYRPYHSKVAAALQNKAVAALIDCHSLNGIGPPDAPDPGQRRKDVVLSNNGDLQGHALSPEDAVSCSPQTLHLFKEIFEAQGFSVALNSPYKGGYITRHYGALLSSNGRFAIQIEMNRSLYMTADESAPQPDRIAPVAQQVRDALQKMAEAINRGV